MTGVKNLAAVKSMPGPRGRCAIIDGDLGGTANRHKDGSKMGSFGKMAARDVCTKEKEALTPPPRVSPLYLSHLKTG